MAIWEKKFECCPREELEQLQLERLQSSLNRAYKNVLFYRNSFDLKKIVPEDISTLADFKHLPLTTKKDLQDNYPYASRWNADNTFTRLNLDFLRIQKVASRSFLILRGSGQYSMDPLTVSELFAIGGPDSVRGYMQSEYLGDSGYSLSAEFRTPILRKSERLQGALFVDTGSIYIKAPQPGQDASKSLTGAGLGLRYALDDNSFLRLDAGWPLSPEQNFEKRNPMVYGQFSVRFHVK